MALPEHTMHTAPDFGVLHERITEIGRRPDQALLEASQQDILTDAAVLGEAAMAVLGSRVNYLGEGSVEPEDSTPSRLSLIRAAAGGLQTVRLAETQSGRFHDQLCAIAIGLPQNREDLPQFRPPVAQGLFVMRGGSTYFPLRGAEGLQHYATALPYTARLLGRLPLRGTKLSIPTQKTSGE